MSAPDAMPFSEQRRILLHKLLTDKGVVARARSAIEPTPDGEDLHLSFAQERMWFFEQVVPGTAVYNLPAVVRMVGALDRSALRTALDAALGSHSALHATFISDRGRPVLQPREPRPFPMIFHDLTGLPADEAEAEARRLIVADLT